MAVLRTKASFSFLRAALAKTVTLKKVSKISIEKNGKKFISKIGIKIWFVATILEIEDDSEYLSSNKIETKIIRKLKLKTYKGKS